jgi:hypothetical protein
MCPFLISFVDYPRRRENVTGARTCGRRSYTVSPVYQLSDDKNLFSSNRVQLPDVYLVHSPIIIQGYWNKEFRVQNSGNVVDVRSVLLTNE